MVSATVIACDDSDEEVPAVDGEAAEVLNGEAIAVEVEADGATSPVETPEGE